jgi:GT2 family glycosyltransferase
MSTASSPGAEAPSGTTVTVTVVICAYTPDRWDRIVAAVASVRHQRVRPEQIVLVIDHNAELLDRATAAFTDVTVLPNAGPRGLSGARNTGLAASRGDVVAFLDDDAEAENDWLDRLVQHYADPHVIGVGGRAEPVWDRVPPRWFPAEFLWVVGCSFTGQPTQVSPVRNMLGCNMSFRRAAMDGAGGFDPALGRIGTVPVGCEETEFCIRLRGRHASAEILYEPAAGVRHLVTTERATWRYFRRRCYSEGRSKAVVTQLAGAESGLSAERDYTRSTLPRGVARELRGSVTDPAALLRAATIVAGLAITASGYLSGCARRLATGYQVDQRRSTAQLARAGREVGEDPRGRQSGRVMGDLVDGPVEEIR